MLIGNKLKEALFKSRKGFASRILSLFRGSPKLTEELYDQLEELLIISDVGVKTSTSLIVSLRERAKKEGIATPEALQQALKEEMIKRLEQGPMLPIVSGNGLCVLLIAGINGVGKTTSIAKLAHMLKREGKKVLLAAADTYRAAASEQLEIWSHRVGTELVKGQRGQDSAALAYDALKAALARGCDVLIIDTAGRLHTKQNLMEELKKIKRVVAKGLEERGRMEVWLVLDATTGQNALLQAKTFSSALGLSGIILAKLDGTARGGIIFSIKEELSLPIPFIGLGEGLEDLRPFDPKEFVEALFEEP